jgi:hypothetical protein
MALTRVKKVSNASLAGSISADKLNIGQIGGRRNMVINGAMQVAQRGTSQASITSTNYYTIDRWQVAITNGGTWTMSQDTDVPTGEGFANSLKMDCTTADTSFGASDSLYVRTKLESQDCQNMKKGTSNAEKVTLRFWVKSSKTGTHIVELLDNDNSRFVSLAYTISSANTWENHTLTFPADTTGAFADDNGVGLGIHWYMGAGSNISSGTLGTTWHTTQANRAAGQVNLADSTDNNWYLTGVQLEVGSQATPFEHRSFGEELALCQRYLFNGDLQCLGSADGAGNIQLCVQTPVNLRANPTLVSFSSALRGALIATATGAAFSAMVAPRVTISVTNTGSTNTLVAGFGGSCSVHLDSEL